MVVTIVHDGQVVKNLTVFNTENGPAVKFYKTKWPVKPFTLGKVKLIDPNESMIEERIVLLKDCEILQSSVELPHTCQNQILQNVKFDYAYMERGPRSMDRISVRQPMKINEDLPND